MKNFKPFMLLLCFANTCIATEQSLSLYDIDNDLSSQNFESSGVLASEDIVPEHVNAGDIDEQKLRNMRLRAKKIDNEFENIGNELQNIKNELQKNKNLSLIQNSDRLLSIHLHLEKKLKNLDNYISRVELILKTRK